MVSLATHARIDWMAPLPLWAQPTPVGLRPAQEPPALCPAILRFDHDDFMREYLDMLADEPQRMRQWLVEPETWREPMASPVRSVPREEDSPVAYLIGRTRRLTRQLRRTRDQGEGSVPGKRLSRLFPAPARAADAPPLKLYQAAHQRHYLICASLVHAGPGLAEVEEGETAYVVRRLLPLGETSGVLLEHAFVEGRWRPVAAHDEHRCRRLMAGEECLPLFAVRYGGECDVERRIHSAVLPLNRREQWLGAPVERASAMAAGDSTPGAEALLLQAEVIAPWLALIEQAAWQGRTARMDFAGLEGDVEASERRIYRSARDVIQTGSWYVLLDLARFLERHLPELWRALRDGGQVASAEAQAVLETLRSIVPRREAPVFQALAAHPHFTEVPGSLAEALLRVRAAAPGLESVDEPLVCFDTREQPLALDSRWPDFVFPLTDPAAAVLQFPSAGEETAAVTALGEAIAALLPVRGDVSAGGGIPDDTEQARFIVRCVYRRAACGPLFPAVVGAASEAFQIAPFFDPDAPARPVRIPMPMDISPAGLRKYQKNVGIVMSDMLCGRFKRMRKLGLVDLVLSVLPWPLGRDLPASEDTACKDAQGGAMGMMLMISIPIVTLCALIVMTIFVALFDIIFRWLPYLFVWVPVPGLKAKGGGAEP